MNRHALDLARQLTALDPSSDDALEAARLALCSGQPMPHRLERVVADVVAVWADRVVAHAKKGGPKLRDEEETRAEARIWLLEQLREYRPAEDGGSVAVFLRARLSWFRSATRRFADGSGRTHSSYTVSSVSGLAREDLLRENHREPSSTELKARVRDILVAQTREKVLESGEFASEDEVEHAVAARLKKDGVAAALDRFDEIRVESRPALPIQLLEPREEDPRPHWGVALPVVEFQESDVRDEEEDYERLLQVALGDQQWARSAFSARAGEAPSGADTETASTLRDLAADADCTIAELKTVLSAARSRVAAPHAQWAHLAPSLEIEN